MQTLTVHASGTYDILVGRGLLARAGELTRAVNRSRRVLVVSDSNVAPLYAETVLTSFAAAGYEASLFTFPAGEQSKRLETVAAIYGRLAAGGFTRGDLLAALGGGVTGDMTGFAAATYLRGMAFVQLPTSLLAQVDSSVGGKTGVDIAEGKNLVGAFWQPIRVIADVDALSSLPATVFADGMGEVIKAACIRDAALFDRLAAGDAMVGDGCEEVIVRCIDIKRQVVENDERESGERKLLNFGHTLAHALEKYYHYETLSHGSAVAVGMVEICRAAERSGLTEAGTAERIAHVLRDYGLPSEDTAPMEAYLAEVGMDKKRSGTGIDLVLLRRVGESYVHPVEMAALPAFFGL